MIDAPFPIIDAHTHFFYDRSYLEDLFRRYDLRVMVINITGHGLLDTSMQARWNAMVALKERHPERVMLCTTFEPAGVTQPGFAERVVEQLQADLRQGATVVKVWKDIGLRVQDDGSWVQIDDPRFQPIWAFLAEHDVPVLAHIAEPKAAWEPLDRSSPHFAYYREHPQHHLYRRSDVPTWEALIAARDRWVAAHPELTIIGAHFGSMAHDVGEVAKRLDRYTNFYVDTAERFGDLLVQPSERVRAFFEDYADRILYGTDVLLQQVQAEDEALEGNDYEAQLADHWRYLAGEGTIEAQDKLIAPVTTEALHLPERVLERVYVTNAFQRFTECR